MSFCCWLQGYQSFTQALGVLELKEARDAFLASLCSFALSSKMAEDADVDLPMSPASVLSPSGALKLTPFHITDSRQVSQQMQTAVLS